MWIFGYGSLLWNPNFSYATIKPGVVRGYARRFWQLSPDHRGTDENPGRTVTLVTEPGAVTWGMAYKVPEDQVEATIEYLNMREIAGYERETVDFYPDDGSEPFELEVYISVTSPNNIYFEPMSSIDEIVETIATSRGKSGTNLEYALRLAQVHRRNAPHIHDPHLVEIEMRLLKICEAKRINDNILAVLGYKLSHLAANS